MNGRGALVAVIGLVAVALAVVVGAIILALDDKTIPDSLIAIGSAAGGALAGVIVVRSPAP